MRGQPPRRLQRLAAVILAVAEQDQVGVGRLELAEHAERLQQRCPDRAAALRDALGAGGREAIEEQGVVARERARDVGSSGKRHETEAVAALRAQGLEQGPCGRLGLREPARCGVLGQHAERDVENDDDVATLERQARLVLARARLHQRDGEAGDRADETERAAPAVAHAGQHAWRQRVVDEQRKRPPAAAEAVRVQQQECWHQSQEQSESPDVETHPAPATEWFAGAC